MPDLAREMYGSIGVLHAELLLDEGLELAHFAAQRLYLRCDGCTRRLELALLESRLLSERLQMPRGVNLVSNVVRESLDISAQQPAAISKAATWR